MKPKVQLIAANSKGLIHYKQDFVLITIPRVAAMKVPLVGSNGKRRQKNQVTPHKFVAVLQDKEVISV